MKDVVVVGGVFREVLDGDVAPRPRLGGSGLTAALPSAQCNARTSLVSYVGEEDLAVATSMTRAADVDTGSLLVLPGASGTFVFPSAGALPRPWPMYRPAEAVPVAAPAVPIAEVYLVFGIPDFDPIAAGWLDGLPEDATLIWDRQGWMSRARDSRAAAALNPRRKILLANLQEGIDEFGGDTTSALVARLPPIGYESAVVKLGDAGLAMVSKAGKGRTSGRVGAFDVEVGSTI